ncbi:phage tail protein [Vibrio harveyi]|uniref:phage tail-collar fiber domain-containing protein n=1 Tax=Vibrio harveyi TaxID=669 RepID=UPI0036F20387
MANTTDKSILTAAGKALLAQLNAEEKPLIIDKMIFANVPNRPEFPQPDDVVPTDHVVHQEGVEQRGRLSADSVIYSTTLTSDVGPFEFNWTGAYCSEYGVLVTIDHHALTPKSADEPGVAGNTLVRSVVLEYKDIAEITNITVDASSWQYNATPRMKKMDDDVAQAIIDQNGKDWFIEDGFLVTPQASAFNIKAGAGYVSGSRVTLEFDRNVQAPNKPSFIYVDAHREGTPTGEQVTLFDFVITAEEKDDYTDANGVKHFVCKIAQVLGDGSVSDLRQFQNLSQAKVIAKDTTKPRELAERFIDVINVRDFGAVGDGDKDDTDAINQAINYAIESGVNNVFIPSGQYNVSEIDITPKKRGFTFLGAGKYTTIFNFVGGGKFKVNRVDKQSDYVTLDYFSLHGNGLGDGCYIYVNYVNMTNVLIKGFRNFNYYIEGLVSHHTNCHFLADVGSPRSVVRTGWNATYFSHCYFNGNNGDGSKTVAIDFQQVDGKQECVHHVVSESTIESGIINIYNAAGVIIKNNYIEETDIIINGDGDKTNVDDIRIIDNHVVEAAPSIKIDNIDPRSSIVVTGNDSPFQVELNVKDSSGQVNEYIPLYNVPEITIDNLIKRENPVVINGTYKMDGFKCNLTQIEGDNALRRVSFVGLNEVTENSTEVSIVKWGYKQASANAARGTSIEEKTICYRVPGQSSKYIGVFHAVGSTEYTASSMNSWRHDVGVPRNPRNVSISYVTDLAGTSINLIGEDIVRNQWSMDLNIIYVE